MIVSSKRFRPAKREKDTVRVDQNATLLLPLNRDPNEFIGLSIDAGVMVPSLEPNADVMVPVRDDETELPFIESKVSARSKTLPLNIPLYEAL